MVSDEKRCAATTKAGSRCKNSAQAGSAFCAVHSHLEGSTAVDLAPTGAQDSGVTATGPTTANSEQRDPRQQPFTPQTLDSSVVAMPLLDMLREEQKLLDTDPSHPPKAFDIIIDLNLNYPQGSAGARQWVIDKVTTLIGQMGRSEATVSQGINLTKSKYSQQYLFGKLEGYAIRALVKSDGEPKNPEATATSGWSAGPRAIYHIWPDFPVRSLINRSISTVKADAAQTAFSSQGEGIVWAVVDSGIDKGHAHFKMHGNLELRSPLEHTDFTGTGSADQDAFGHGTHVAGIIAGQLRSRSAGYRDGGVETIQAYTRMRDEHGEITYNPLSFNTISGMAPKCKLLSLKVLDGNGDGLASNIIAAIAMIQELNGYGRRLQVHGVNMSVGYDFDPEWFACGQSPLCVEVNRLVRSGVAVVVAAGNTGYGYEQSLFRGTISAGLDLTINDPGNAELAITVGSTHKDMPHVYGVSYFSSKGPTGDGRSKPDLVAPGEKIISCSAGKLRADMKDKAGECDYLEQSGTSMAAPHVSGVIAAFLSIRQEFIGYPERVKDLFLASATDLKRERHFQGFGLVDLMRAIQSV